MTELSSAQCLEVLAQARKVVPCHQRWTVCRRGADAQGNDVDPRSERAVRFCALGMIDRALSDLGIPDDERLTEQVAEELVRTLKLRTPRAGQYWATYAVADWNNTTNFDTVADGFDRTIARLKA